MGKEKAGFLTPKAISNRIKAKGLQKLRWFCQMCQKQCRDENGFKCHLTSESHQRQLLLFAENPHKYIDDFSQEFLDTFMELLRRRFGTKRVHGNIVYQEYISDREHTHMNATQWETLTDFVKWLGREGYCVVDETEKGWFIQYIDRDPETIRKQEALQKKEKMTLDDQEKSAKFIKQQIERAKAAGVEEQTPEATELQREDEEEKVTFSLAASKQEESKAKASPALLSKTSAFDDKSGSSSKSSKAVLAGQKRKSALDEIMEFEEHKKEKVNRKDHWLHENIVVKVITKQLGSNYYKKKGVVREVKDLYAGVIKLLDSGEKIKVDQTHLETVIPSVSKAVMIVNGAYRGKDATLLSLEEKKFSCSVRINSGPLNGRVIDGVKYEDLCKLHS